VRAAPEPHPATSVSGSTPTAVLPKYSGRCQGGPIDGLNLYHGEPLFRMAARDGKSITYCGPPTEEISISWYHFAGGQWVYHSTEEPPREDADHV
jgi:hypothetical protein